VYLYVRAGWRKPSEDAKDLTQAFFLWLLDGEPLKSYAPERGGFRTYLKVLLRRFVGHEDAALGRLKRGGGVLHLPITDDAAVADVKASNPEELFDRAWIAALVDGAVDRVRARCDRDGRSVAFRVYEGYDLVPGGESPTYSQLGERLGIPVNEVKNHLFAVREEVRAEVRADLAQATADPEELEAEWKALFRK